MQILPFAGFASFTEEIVLDNTPYKITFNWNNRGEFWTMDILDIDNNILYSGIKVVLMYELIADFPDRNLPLGGIVAVDPARIKSIIDRDDIGNEISIIYATEEEFAAI